MLIVMTGRWESMLQQYVKESNSKTGLARDGSSHFVARVGTVNSGLVMLAPRARWYFCEYGVCIKQIIICAKNILLAETKMHLLTYRYRIDAQLFESLRQKHGVDEIRAWAEVSLLCYCFIHISVANVNIMSII